MSATAADREIETTKMTALPNKARRIWLRSFYGFSPEDDGYIGWSEEGPRDRMLGLAEDGDLFIIYGADSADTPKSHRNRVVGFLEVEARAIRDIDKASPVGMQHKRTRGWEDKWTYAMPVVRAWRVDEPILLERIASKTYRPEAGQAIALWSPPLLSEEVDLALKIKVTEVSVFGEPPLPETALKRNPFGEAFRPSRASEPYEGRRAAEAAEQAFKDKAVKQLQSLGESSSAEIGFPQSLSSQRYPAFRGLENESLRRLSRRIIGAPS